MQIARDIKKNMSLSRLIYIYMVSNGLDFSYEVTFRLKHVHISGQSIQTWCSLRRRRDIERFIGIVSRTKELKAHSTRQFQAENSV